MPEPSSRSRKHTMIAVRYVLPAAICIGGILLFALNPNLDTADGAAAIVGAGLSVLLLNLLYRMGVSGDRDRDREDEARRYFDEHGYWPDEAERHEGRSEPPRR